MHPQPSCLDIDEHRVRVRMKDLRIGDVTHVTTERGRHIIKRCAGLRVSRVKIRKPGGEIVNFTSMRTSGGGWAECIEVAINVVMTGEARTSDDTKRCSGECKQLLPRTTEYFWKHSRSADGLQSVCKECLNRRKRELTLMRTGGS